MESVRSVAPLVVRVAKASVSERIALTNTAPRGPQRVLPGQTIHVQFEYAFEESSSEKEDFVFSLGCELRDLMLRDDLVKPTPVTEHFKDHWGRNDARAGRLVQTIRVPRVGDFQLTFRAEVQYLQGPWRSSTVAKKEQESVFGSFEVVAKSG